MGEIARLILSDNAVLRVVAQLPDKWLEFFLSETRLGAESAGFVLNRLSKVFQTPDELDFRTVITFAENHHSIYISRSDFWINLVAQDADANHIGNFSVTHDDFSRFVDNLADVLSRVELID